MVRATGLVYSEDTVDGLPLLAPGEDVDTAMVTGMDFYIRETGRDNVEYFSKVRDVKYLLSRHKSKKYGALLRVQPEKVLRDLKRVAEEDRLLLEGVDPDVVFDNVTHPSHYNRGKIEVAEFIRDQDLNHFLGSAVKYIARAGYKDGNEKKQELEKAIQYLSFELNWDDHGSIH